MDIIERSFNSASPEDSMAVAFNIGQKLKGGEVIELSSDLGGGKTTFTKGLVSGLGSTESVSSPTFTISKEYTSGRLPVYHFDFYRLQEAGIVAEELMEIIGEYNGVTVVEWAGIVEGFLPEQRIKIEFLATGETSRKLKVLYPEGLAYLMEGV